MLRNCIKNINRNKRLISVVLPSYEEFNLFPVPVSNENKKCIPEQEYNGLIDLDNKIKYVNLDTYGPPGFVKLVDCMPRYIPESCKHLMCDHAIVPVSYTHLRAHET